MSELENTKTTAQVTWGPVAAVLVTVSVFFGGQLLGGLVVAILPGLFGWSNQQISTWFSSSTTGQFLLIAGVEVATFSLLYWFIRYRKSSLQAIGLVKPRLRDAGYALAGVAVYFPAYILTTVVLTQLIPSLNVDQPQQIGFQQADTRPELLLVFIALVILPPLIEEMLCRGFLFSGLKTKLPIMTAALLTGMVFAAPHLQIGSGEPLLWVAFIDTFILSMVLVYVRVKSGGLWASIGLHAIKNGIAFVALFVLRIA